MSISRRDVLRLGGVSVLAGVGVDAVAGCDSRAAMSAAVPLGKADYTLRIATGPVELAPGTVVSTTTYNGRLPGPLLR
ncbi:hypothetical protein [Streptomyces sp. NPDC048665]|uniref:hypothetical protein n=1 Tax=Streptomyces sp. NPDC048665 TaxID=3155490 RepID=UPI003448190C